ncbi:MAG: single-stranded DNA-binding protein [Lachnospiraceae bacterium]|jgi:single-strand DNA-binding protein|nr:single-stranded DNA-binding protein [Lachnospiraceae bacterium]
MNQVILMGRLTRDPEVRYTQAEPPIAIARYTLAVDRRGSKTDGQPAADFINCVAFDRAGEFAEKYFLKGMRVLVSGRIQTGSYTNRDGVRIYTTDVIIQSQEFAESRNTASGSNAPQMSGEPIGNGFMSIPDGMDEGLPFN